ncbi:MAG: hypothetical protein DI552_00250 [Brevundimonas sp.]|nr:MAG: hypothetical protein DI552_00250 [Brevundimonas sp.]
MGMPQDNLPDEAIPLLMQATVRGLALQRLLTGFIADYVAHQADPLRTLEAIRAAAQQPEGQALPDQVDQALERMLGLIETAVTEAQRQR